jgi:formylmethanofuran dehydrogenase subunit D
MWFKSGKSMKTYTSKVLEICENGDAIIELPDEMLEELKWKEGDKIDITEQNGNIFIKKIDDDDKKISLDK